MINPKPSTAMTASHTLTTLSRFLTCRTGAGSKLPSTHRLLASTTPTTSRLVSSKASMAELGSEPSLATQSEFTDGDDTMTMNGDEAPSAMGFPSESASTSPAVKRDTRTGAFQKVPMVAPSKEIWESAFRKANRVAPNRKLKNEAAKAKNQAARQFDTLMKELTVPLGAYEKGFPSLKKLHPFENALLELTLGADTYGKVLGRVSSLRKGAVEVAKGYAARCSKAANKKDALDLREEGFARVEAVYLKNAGAVDELKEVAKSLRRLPVVDPALPTVALVGAPNVGKSSLVQLLSSGLPEVQNYPFTTRSIKMGHFYVDGRRHQVTDTPGLLNRSDEERNAMERLTLASLQHLPTAVLFVVDLTAECGTSVGDQWLIRNKLREKFPTKPWIDVFSKRDLLEEELDEADERRTSNPNQPLVPHQVQDAVGFAMAVPDALRVSSVTGDGIDGLKAAMLEMLESGDLGGQVMEGWGGQEEREEEEEERANALAAEELHYGARREIC